MAAGLHARGARLLRRRPHLARPRALGRHRTGAGVRRPGVPVAAAVARREGAPAECHRVQLDSVQPRARHRPALRRRRARRLRHGGLLRAERRVVPRGHCRHPVAAHPAHSGADQRRGCARNSRRASRSCARIERLIGLSVLGFATTFLGNPLLTFLPLFAKNVFGGDVKQYTLPDGSRRRRRGHRRARRGMARQVPPHGTHAAAACSSPSVC